MSSKQDKLTADAAIAQAKAAAEAAGRPENAEVSEFLPALLIGLLRACPANPRRMTARLIVHIRAIFESMSTVGWQGPPVCAVDLRESPAIARYFSLTDADVEASPYMMFAGHCRTAAASGQGCGKGEDSNYNGTDGAPVFDTVPVLVYRFKGTADFLRSMIADTIHERHDALSLAEVVARQAEARVAEIIADLEATAATLGAGKHKDRVNEKVAEYKSGKRTLSTRERAALVKGLDHNAVARLDRIMGLPDVLRAPFGDGLAIAAVDWIKPLADKCGGGTMLGAIGEALAKAVKEGKSPQDCRRVTLATFASLAKEEPKSGDNGADGKDGDKGADGDKSADGKDGDKGGKPSEAQRKAADHNTVATVFTCTDGLFWNGSAQMFAADSGAEAVFRLFIMPVLDNPALSSRRNGLDKSKRDMIRRMFLAHTAETFRGNDFVVRTAEPSNVIKATAGQSAEVGAEVRAAWKVATKK